MHAPRIPLDFDFYYEHGGLHITSGDTAAFWFGALMLAGMSWKLWSGFQPGGDFGLYMWIFPPADRDHPLMYWMMAAVCLALLLVGVDLAVSGLFGLHPLSFI